MTLTLNDLFKDTVFGQPVMDKKHYGSSINKEKVPRLTTLTPSGSYSELVDRDQLKVPGGTHWGCLIQTEESSGGNCWGDSASSHSVSLSDAIVTEFETIMLNADEMNLRISDYIRIKRCMKKIEDVYFSEYYGNGSRYDYYYFLEADIKYALSHK